jgi:hypothetical protein
MYALNLPGNVDQPRGLARSALTSPAMNMQGGPSALRSTDKGKLLAELVLYRILCLVRLLDSVPRHMQLPQEAPFIFRLNAPHKSSEELLIDCLQASLSGIGKLSRHLARASYVVDHRQRDVDEWTMDVTSLGSDLSNGVVLCKLVSVLFGTVRPMRTPCTCACAVKSCDIIP